MSCADSDTDMFVLDHCRCWFRRVWKPLAPGGKALLEYERYCTDAVDDLRYGEIAARHRLLPCAALGVSYL